MTCIVHKSEKLVGICKQRPISFFEEGICVCKGPFLGDFIHVNRLLEEMSKRWPNSDACVVKALGCSTSSPKAFERFKSFRSFVTPSAKT